MPIYEYVCADCGNAFSHLHKRFNEPFPPCPQCGSSNVKKELSTFSTSTESSNGCDHAGECAHAQASAGHHCCNGCCHHH